MVVAGDIVGTVDSLGAKVDVSSPFSGALRGLLASPGERVREGQPVAWVALVDPASPTVS